MVKFSDTLEFHFCEILKFFIEFFCEQDRPFIFLRLFAFLWNTNHVMHLAEDQTPFTELALGDIR